MSLEDHNLATIMEDTKNLKQSIVDEHYIDYVLHQQGMGQEDEDDIRDKEVERITREHARDVTSPILRRNAELARRRRDDGPDGVPTDEAVPPSLTVRLDEGDERLHFTYDQGEKAQHLAQLARIMKPAWNNTTQSPNEFIKTFQNWRDEIYNNYHRR
eukprot:1646863-Amphidinium_carterae.1